MVFTGAGISRESGIPTFREDSGLWERFPPDRFATPQGLLDVFLRAPEELTAFLDAVLSPVAEAKPNPAHRAIAALEERKTVVVVTQNIDGLHQEAGSRDVLEIHGSLFDIRSSWAGAVRTLSRAQLVTLCEKLARAAQAPSKHAAILSALSPMFGVSWRGHHRPSIVLFGESLREPDWTRAQREADECDAMLVIGTSGAVMPAASLPMRAHKRGATIIAIDPQPYPGADLQLTGAAGELAPQLIEAALSFG